MTRPVYVVVLNRSTNFPNILFLYLECNNAWCQQNYLSTENKEALLGDRILQTNIIN